MGVNVLTAKVDEQARVIEALKVRLLEAEGRILTLERAVESLKKPLKQQRYGTKQHDQN
jgi:hypothetical protein